MNKIILKSLLSSILFFSLVGCGSNGVPRDSTELQYKGLTYSLTKVKDKSDGVEVGMKVENLSSESQIFDSNYIKRGIDKEGSNLSVDNEIGTNLNEVVLEPKESKEINVYVNNEEKINLKNIKIILVDILDSENKLLEFKLK